MASVASAQRLHLGAELLDVRMLSEAFVDLLLEPGNAANTRIEALLLDLGVHAELITYLLANLMPLGRAGGVVIALKELLDGAMVLLEQIQGIDRLRLRFH